MINLDNMQKLLSVVKSVVDLVKSVYLNESRVNDESITFFLVWITRNNKGKVEEDACIQVAVVNSVFTWRLTY